MTVTTPPRPASRDRSHTVVELHEEALIKEARERARRRRRRRAGAIVIAASVVGAAAAFAMRADGGAAPRSAAAARPLAPAAFSATPSAIVFASWNGKAALYTINADGTNLHRVLGGTQARLAGNWPSWPALSRDGREIAFQAGVPTMRPAIEVVSRGGTGVHRIAPLGEHPSWSPDGTRIAYSRGAGGIYIVHADGTGRRRLAGGGFFPSWSPDGTKLAYTCPTHPPYRTCVMHADGTGQRQIAAVGDFATPAWSPDGSKIAFLGGFPDVRVYVVDANGTNLRRLPPTIDGKSQDCGPAWSPNGKRIAFSRSDRTIEDALGNHAPGGLYGGIYLMNADGRHVVHLKGTTGDACGITWQPTPTSDRR